MAVAVTALTATLTLASVLWGNRSKGESGTGKMPLVSRAEGGNGLKK